ncbi:MAG: HepT-like ribonuclease domain-containing protein [Candidatus Helarchaeota archaeon]
MHREYKLYIKDILKAINKIEKYTYKISFKDFIQDELRMDAVIRNLEVVDEAVKNIPEDFKYTQPEIEWKKITGLRDILIHAYFSIDFDILWDIIKNKIPKLKKDISKI